MKKITTVVIIMLLVYQTKSQSVSVNYNKNFVAESKGFIKNGKFVPYAVSQFIVAYSQNLRKLPININVTAVTSWRQPPRLGQIPPPWPKRYLLSNIEADSIVFSNSKSSSVDLLIGGGYDITLSDKFFISVNADFGLSLNNKQSVNYFFQKRWTGAAEVAKTQLIVNPNIQAKYYFTKNIGVNLTAGYNNTGGANAGVGLVVRTNKSANRPRRRWDPHTCLICGGYHLRRGCSRPY